MPFVSAIVLAAGASTRMGRQKALMEFAGTTLVDYHVTQLRASGEVAEIIVVTGHEPEAVVAALNPHRDVRIVHNAEYSTGKVSSIKAGLRTVSPAADSVLIIAVDQPRPGPLFRELVRNHNASSAPITIPTSNGRRGHPIVLRIALLTDLTSMTERDQGLRGILKRHQTEIQEVELHDERVLVDLNAPADANTAASLNW